MSQLFAVPLGKSRYFVALKKQSFKSHALPNVKLFKVIISQIKIAQLILIFQLELCQLITLQNQLFDSSIISHIELSQFVFLEVQMRQGW